MSRGQSLSWGLGGAGALFLRLLGSTWRLEWDGLEKLDEARKKSPCGNVIYAFWHNSLAMLAWTHRARNIQVLVSQHRDGEHIARIVSCMGMGLVRGSSRRGGTQALFRLATHLEAGLDVAVTVDGPIGPRYRVQGGVVLLARRTGRPIVPLIPTFEKGIRLSTWDELRIPALRSRVRVQHGAAFWVEPGSVPGALTARRLALEAEMGRITKHEESRFGHEIVLDDVQDRRSFWERKSEEPKPASWLRLLSRGHEVGRRLETWARPRPGGLGRRPWVVGIGNLEAGGTGKTPCTLLLAEAIRARGVRVVVLVRGFAGRLGRRPVFATAENQDQASDETRLLTGALGPGTPVLVARDKQAGLRWLERDGTTDVVLVDDAFQTANLAVDRHLVLLDWERPLGNGYLLPAGRLRERPAALDRADAVLWTRARGNQLPLHPELDAVVRPGRGFLAFETASGLRTPAGVQVPNESLRGEGVLLLSGVGRPRAFEQQAQAIAARSGFEIRRRVRIGDHAPVEPMLRKVMGRLQALGCRYVITTRKDLMRLPPESKWNEPLLVLEQRLEIPDLARLLDVLLEGYSSSP